MTAAEADAMLARETGWPVDYVKGLDEYQKRLLLGWKPRPDPEEQNRDMLRQIAMLKRGQSRGR